MHKMTDILNTHPTNNNVNCHVDEEGESIRSCVRNHLICDADLTREEAIDAEIGVFNWALDSAESKSITKSWKQSNFVTIYTCKAKSILANLDDKSFVGNSKLVARMRSGEFFPHQVAFMKPQDVFPERWKQVLDSKVQKEDYIYNEKPSAMTDQFRCGRCKQKECMYRELQLRSCDEPVSLFITCLKCGNNWRIG
jgi:DNA-directed RNA polymerase subunit M/transcription elongation factor TFIIS